MDVREIPADDFEALASVHPEGTPPKLSARLYEFFFTTYAQHNPCVHSGINIGAQYLQNSRHFTFFRRQPEVIFGIKPTGVVREPLKVTKGQLALFRWIYDNDIHTYIVTHLDKIKTVQQEFKKIPRSQIANEAMTLDSLTLGLANLQVSSNQDEDTVRLGVPRNRRFFNRELITQKRTADQRPA